MTNMQNTIKRVWNTATTVLLSIVLILAILIWGFRLFGFEVLVVQSGSMEPAYHTGSLVYIRDVDANELQEGDVITFNIGNGLRATHRIIDVVEQEGQLGFRTKGDANDHPDNGLVSASSIVGKVAFSIPYLGYMTAYIQSPPGMYVAMSAAAMILLLMILPDIIFTDKKSHE